MPTRRHRGFARTEAESSVRKSSTLGAAATRRRGGLVGVAPGRRQQGPAIRLPDAGSAAQVSLWLSESEIIIFCRGPRSEIRCYSSGTAV